MGIGQLSDIGMRERQEVREEEDRGMRHETKLKGKGRKRKDQMRREERKVIKV